LVFVLIGLGLVILVLVLRMWSCLHHWFLSSHVSMYQFNILCILQNWPCLTDENFDSTYKIPIKYKDTTQLNTNTEERISKSLYKSPIFKQAVNS